MAYTYCMFFLCFAHKRENKGNFLPSTDNCLIGDLYELDLLKNLDKYASEDEACYSLNTVCRDVHDRWDKAI